MQTYLIFDTETTGKWNFKAPANSPEQPDPVQIAFKLVSDTGLVISQFSTLIKDHKSIDSEAAQIHGITPELTAKFGMSALDAGLIFANAIEYADYLVAHNYAFDSAVLSKLAKGSWSMTKKPSICTMVSTVEFCALPSSNKFSKYKWPKLQELHHKLFDRGFRGAHDAMVDVDATTRCFLELKRRGVL